MVPSRQDGSGTGLVRTHMARSLGGCRKREETAFSGTTQIQKQLGLRVDIQVPEEPQASAAAGFLQVCGPQENIKAIKE